MPTIEQIETKVEEAWDGFATGSIRTFRGALAGLIGGAVAAWVMNRYRQIEDRPVNVRRAGSSGPLHGSDRSVETGADSDDPTVNTAQAISTRLLDHELSPCEKKIAGPAVHYGYGAAVGALYGGLAELIPTVGIGLGIPYATVVFLAGDEIAVPALGLSKSPVQTPTAKHVSRLATHFVYGITLDVTRRVLRRLI